VDLAEESSPPASQVLKELRMTAKRRESARIGAKAHSALRSLHRRDRPALMEQAGLPPPEYEVVAGEVLVRFRSRDKPSSRDAGALSLLQNRILAVLRDRGPCSMATLVYLCSALVLMQYK
jgi:hypothetical protein